MENTAKEIGERLKKARKKSGYTQKEVTEKTKISQQRLSQYETGKREMDYKSTIDLSDLYEISLDWLFNTNPKRK